MLRTSSIIFLVIATLTTFISFQFIIYYTSSESLSRHKIVSSRFFHKVTSRCKDLNILFTPSEVSNFWKYKNYKECPKPISKVYFKKNKLIAQCYKGQAEYLVDPGYSQRLGGLGYGVFWKDSLNLTENSEFLIVRCLKSYDEKFAFVFNRYNDQISKRAKEIEISLKGNSTLSVLMLVFDSVSRGSAYRNWPKTMNFLNEMKKYHDYFSFYDFENPLVTGVHTRPNMVPIIYGQSESEHNKYFKGAKYDSLWPSKKYLELQSRAIWSHYWEKGYTTLFLYDTIYDYMVKSFGREIKSDHVFVNFWKVVYRVFGFSDFSNRQRCIGSEDSHYYSLNYTYQYLTNYKHNNRFGYVHLDAAHENSGNVRTVDKDLYKFIIRIFEWYIKEKQEIVIFLIGDHGRINPVLQFNTRGFMDQRTPMLFMISSKEVAGKLNVGQNLEFNTKELVGRYDINLSLRDLAFYPYARWNESEYRDEKRKYRVRDVVSLFREKVRKSRTCADLGVASIDCTCKDYEEVDFKNPNEQVIINQLLTLSIKYISIKEKNFSEICQKSSTFNLISVKKFELLPISRGWDTIFNLFLLINNQTLIKTIANFCSYNKIIFTRNTLPSEIFPKSKYHINGTEIFSQITGAELVSQNSNQTLCLFTETNI